MAITESFREAVRDGDLRRVHIMMKDSLLVDKTFREFAEMERAAGDLPELYQEHDGRELIEDESKWDADYMNLLMVQVVSNFSRERVAHLKEVVRRLYPAPAEPETRPGPGVFRPDGTPRSVYEPRRGAGARRAGVAKIVGRAVIAAVIGAAVGAAAVAAVGAAIGAAKGTVAGAAEVGAIAGAAAAGAVAVVVMARGDRRDGDL